MNRLKTLFSRKPAITGLVFILVLLLVGATSILKAEKESNHSGKGYLGVAVEKTSLEDRDEFGVQFGLLVIRVSKGEAAEKAGIKKYDVIQYFNGQKMHRPSDLSEAVRQSNPGAKVKIKLIRDKKELELTATLGELKIKDFDFKWNGKDGKKFFFKSSGAYLGVSLHKLSQDLAEYFDVKANGGALILNVSKNTPAEKAGFKNGDVILKIEGKEVSNPKDVSEILADYEKDDKVAIDILRHGKKKTLNAQLDARPPFHGIKVLKGMGDIDDIHIKIPESHFEGINEDVDIIISEEIEKKMEEAQEKIEKAQKKLEKNHEKIEKKDENITI